MPDRAYTPREPPSIVDRVLHHPFEISMAVWWALCGVVLAVSFVWPELPTSPSIQSLPMWLALFASGFIGGGGFALLVGLLVSWDRLDTGWLVERVALSAGGTGWLMYGAAVALAVAWILSLSSASL